MATSAVVSKAPRLGRKEIFLPNFTLTLLRTPSLPPTFASFWVPLNLHKLDLRDYLWNVYGISVLSVRSYVQIQKKERGKNSRVSSTGREFYRPRSLKKMTVEMDKPFVWPAEPTDLEMWDNAVFKGAEKERKEYSQRYYPDASLDPKEDVESIAAQAKALLKDPGAWATGNSNKWENVGEAVEVEMDVEIPRNESS